MEKTHKPRDPAADWDEGAKRKAEIARWIRIGQLWSVIAMVLGTLLFLFLLYRS